MEKKTDSEYFSNEPEDYAYSMFSLLERIFEAVAVEKPTLTPMLEDAIDEVGDLICHIEFDTTLPNINDAETSGGHKLI